jgi:hypothetical protein
MNPSPKCPKPSGARATATGDNFYAALLVDDTEFDDVDLYQLNDIGLAFRVNALRDLVEV